MHLENIRNSDAIVVANFTKNDVTGYIGANTFLEMGFAYCLGKTLYLLYEIPKLPIGVEIRGLNPVVLNNNLHIIK